MKEELVRLLLPYLMAGLGPDITADYRAASLMILTQLASQATLSDTLITGQSQNALRICLTRISRLAVECLDMLADTLITGQQQNALIPRSLLM